MNRGSGPRGLIIAAALVLSFFAGSLVFSKSVVAVPNTTYESLKVYTDVLNIIEQDYTEEVVPKDLIYDSIRGMMKGLDPHSSFMAPEEYAEMQVETKGSFGGLGIEIGIREGVLTVVAPIEDTPAFNAGIIAGDKIVKINDKPTKDLTVSEAAKQMRGQKGTSVTIHIMREGFSEPKPFTIVRDTIKVKSIKFKELGDGLGYVKIVQFQENTSRDLDKALTELTKKSGPLKGLVLDLRNNPGGLLQEAVKVSNEFLDSGLIVYTKGRASGQDIKFSADDQRTQPPYPIIVIINGGSASASEIVAGALQDHKRAVILGTQSFGKGSVQSIVPLSDGSALRLTTSKYYTPSGRSIQAKGIEPDIVVEDDTHAYLKEKDLSGHLLGDGEKEEKDGVKSEEAKPDKTEKPDKPEKPKKEDISSADKAKGEKEDLQLKRAIEYLKGWEIFKNLKKAA